MPTGDATLLGEIESDVLSGRPLADALRKCIVLGGRAGSESLREWATRELRGYESDVEVPAFRTVGARICADAVTGSAHVTGQHIGPSMLPDFVQDQIDESYTFRQGVGGIEALISEASGHGESSVRIALPMSTEISRVMDAQSGNPYQQITGLYWVVATAELHAILDQVRTTLAELVGEIRAGLATDEGTPSQALANQAVNVAVYGAKARVNIANAQAADGSTARVDGTDATNDSSFWTRSRRVGAFVVGAATVVAAGVALLQWHPWSS